jgi:hypothetical protein
METPMSDDPHYREQLAALNERAAQSELAGLQSDVLNLNQEMENLWDQAAQAQNDGDEETALYYAREARAKTADLQSALARLPQPQQPIISETKQQMLIPRMDLVTDPNYGQNHWSIQSKYSGPRANPSFLDVAQGAHNFSTQQLGHKDDSPEYQSYMTNYLEPPGYQKAWTANDVVSHLQQESKYANLGGKFTARDYNGPGGKHVQEAQRRTAEQLTIQGRKF